MYSYMKVGALCVLMISETVRLVNHIKRPIKMDAKLSLGPFPDLSIGVLFV